MTRSRTYAVIFPRLFVSVGTALLVSACTAQTPEDERFSEQCGTGLQLCSDEGLIEARIFVETCSQGDECRFEPSSQNPFLEFIQLDGPEGKGCGPGDCGAVPDALQQGWQPGRWKIIAPPLRGYETPDPVTIDLQAREVLEVEFTYRVDGVT
jgi:hypothetical protein